MVTLSLESLPPCLEVCLLPVLLGVVVPDCASVGVARKPDSVWHGILSCSP